MSESEPIIEEREASSRKPLAQIQIGKLLIEAGLVTEEQLEKALALQESWGSRVGEILLGMGWVKPIDFYPILASQLGLPFVNLLAEPASDQLFEPADYSNYSKHLYLPWKKEKDVLWIATADPTSLFLHDILEHNHETRLVVTSKFDILWELQRVARTDFSLDAVNQLALTSPERSARSGITREQKFVIAAIIAIMIRLFIAFPLGAAITLNAFLNGFLLLSFLFRSFLGWMSCADISGQPVSREEISALRNVDLPIYTILVPMYREPDVLPILAAALRNLDYPASKLDVKLVLEEDDHETIDAVKRLGLASIFEIVRVPSSQPRTKPKACNYALNFARGEFLTIYDAEDKPEPQQLKKSLIAFNKLGEKAACIQAHLNYFNPTENWLTRMFTLEYTLWFDMFLPALDKLRMPIPLGGTSNHFDLKKLKEVGAWDPFNVTEDADLGLRFAARGYQVGVVDSVTYEEANSRVGNWIRQRSRWIKGYIQTWMVNMRNPFTLFRQVGLKGFISFHLFIGGTILSALAYPLMVIPFISWLFYRAEFFHLFFPRGIVLVSTINLVVGNTFLIYMSMLAAAKRRQYDLLIHALTIPVYWALQSVAGYKAAWQFITKPFYWEKTTHGISKSTTNELVSAAGAMSQ